MFIGMIFNHFLVKTKIFQSGVKFTSKKILKFFGARVITFGVEELGMFILVDLLQGNNLIMKAIVAVLVIILNYIFSKLFVFTKKNKVY